MNILNKVPNTKGMTCMAAIALAALMIPSGPVGAAVQIGTTSSPGTSTTLSVIPNVNGNVAKYAYTVTDGGSLIDSIPVQLCVTSRQNIDWTSFQGQVATQGGGTLPGVTSSANVTFTSAETDPDTNLPVCKTVTISINTGILTLTDPQVSQEFAQNLQVNDTAPTPSTGSDKPQVNWTGPREIQLRVLVQPVTSNISCFITDSSGNFLTKCNGTLADQSGSDEGRFAIVANKKNIEVATNPGQFYYNVLYHNPGSDPITVDVSFVRNGVNTKGTQAIHAALFAPPFSGFTQEGFDAVNDAIPEGADDQVNGITIPAGWTLWVDYHLEWNGLGSPVPNSCGTGCSTANQPFSVVSTVTESGGHSEFCTSGASGYRK